jgi:deoxycytidylate deaminase
MKRYHKLIEMARAMKPLKQSLRAFHVAGIFKKQELVSVGFNTRKTHPKTIKFYPSFKHDNATHAEMLAVIRGRLEDYSGHDLIVVRIDNNYNVNLSAPCQHCANLIKTLNFNKIYYSDSHGNIQEFLFK